MKKEINCVQTKMLYEITTDLLRYFSSKWPILYVEFGDHTHLVISRIAEDMFINIIGQLSAGIDEQNREDYIITFIQKVKEESLRLSKLDDENMQLYTYQWEALRRKAIARNTRNREI